MASTITGTSVSILQSLRTSIPSLLAEEKSIKMCSERSSKPQSPPASLLLKSLSLLSRYDLLEYDCFSLCFPHGICAGMLGCGPLEIVTKSLSAFFVHKGLIHLELRLGAGYNCLFTKRVSEKVVMHKPGLTALLISVFWGFLLL